ncbi:MAG: SGNH/GDSL hydrolase family protein [Candidatus Binatia bacterium]|nr:SGNH/GDSL hydrolase family protein [Candidatus Binatia bacterium]
MRSFLSICAKAFVGSLPALFLVLVVEGILRWGGWGERCNVPLNSVFWVCDPVLGFRASPYFEQLGVKLNRLGLRGPDPTREKRGEVQVLALGDSCTFGILPDPKTVLSAPYPELLARRGAERWGEGRLQVINAGVPGYSTLQALLLLRSKLRSLRPDLVTVRFGWNDHFAGGRLAQLSYREPVSPVLLLAEDWLLTTELYAFARRLGMELTYRNSSETAPPRPPTSWQPSVPLPEYEHYLRRLAQVARSRGAQVWFITAPDALSLPGQLARFESLPPGAPARRALFFNGHKSFQELLEVHEMYREATRRVAKELGVLLIDAALAYQGYNPKELFDDSDVVHPLLLGHQIEAGLLLDQLVASGSTAKKGGLNG